jgi:hypothetical protein
MRPVRTIRVAEVRTSILEVSMTTPDRREGLDHVVVLMFENRSFDNLLGRLYEPGEVESFEGVLGKELSNPIPAWAEHGADRGAVPYGIARDMNTPYPDPSEEYQHVNTQLFRSDRPAEQPRVAGRAEHITFAVLWNLHGDRMCALALSSATRNPAPTRPDKCRAPPCGRKRGAACRAAYVHVASCSARAD